MKTKKEEELRYKKHWNQSNKKNPHIVIHKSKIVPKSNRKHEAEGDRVKIDSIQR